MGTIAMNSVAKSGESALSDVAPEPGAKPSATVRSVERCIDIIDVLSTRRTAMSLSELSRAIDTPKSTTLTIVRTLVHRGLLSFDTDTKHYQIGLGFSRYMTERPRRVDLISLATPFLESLARDTLETATIAMREGDKIYNVCRFVGPQPLQLIVPIGLPRALHTTAGGKIFLAWMPRPERIAYVDSRPLERATPRTVTDPALLHRRLDACKRDGYSVNRGETTPELFGIAAPILGRNAAIVATVNLSGPLFRLQRGQTKYVAAVRKAAALISEQIMRVGGEIALPSAKSVARR